MHADYASLHVRKYPKLALSSESDNEVIFKLDLNTGKIESKEPIILFDEFEKPKDKKESEIKWGKWTVWSKSLKSKALDEEKIKGILTSNIRTRTSTDVPYMTFFRLKYSDREISHSDAELCANAKCKKCEIPVIFRINKGWNHLTKTFDTAKPNLKKGDAVILEGTWANSEKSNRPSFTCYSYQVLKEFFKKLWRDYKNFLKKELKELKIVLTK